MDELVPDVHTSSLCFEKDRDVSEINDCAKYRLMFFQNTSPQKKVLHMTVGVPGAGKTGWRNEIVSQLKQQGIAHEVISFDDIRFRLLDYEHTKKDFDPIIEPEVTSIAKNKLRECLHTNAQKICILDATNVDHEKRQEIFSFAAKENADIYVSIFNVHPEIAVMRDLKRDRTVGRKVIQRMYSTFKQDYPKLWRSKSEHELNNNKMKIAIIDNNLSIEECEKIGEINPLTRQCETQYITSLPMMEKPIEKKRI